jgi:hypothetical protein
LRASPRNGAYLRASLKTNCVFAMGYRHPGKAVQKIRCRTLPLWIRFRAGLSGENFPSRMTCIGFSRNNCQSSGADLIRASTSLFRPTQAVDAHGSSPWAEGPRVKPGHDEIGEAISVSSARRDFPRKVLRFRGNDEKGRQLVEIFGFILGQALSVRRLAVQPGRPVGVVAFT